MGKNDDFAARLARIHEQTNAPDPTGGMTTDPRQARMPELHSKPSRGSNTISQPKVIFGSLATLALAVFLLSPGQAEKHEMAAAAQDSRASLSFFQALPESSIVYEDKQAETAVRSDISNSAEEIWGPKDHHITETDARVALLVTTQRHKKDSVLGMMPTLQRYASTDGQITGASQGLTHTIVRE